MAHSDEAGKDPLDSIHSQEDLERYLASLQDEAIRTAFVGGMLGLTSPEQDQQLGEITASLAETTGMLPGTDRSEHFK